MSHNPLLDLIGDRRTVRSYTKKKVSRAAIDRLLRAASRSPSLHNMQPWRFVVVTRGAEIKALAEMMGKRSKDLFAGFNIIVKETSKVILNAPLVVIVYNACDLSRRMEKFGEPYWSITKVSELQSVSGAIENMALAAHALGLGLAWLTAPLFCEDEIRDFFGIKGPIVALVSIGHPAGQTSVSPRKPLASIAEFR